MNLGLLFFMHQNKYNVKKKDLRKRFFIILISEFWLKFYMLVYIWNTNLLHQSIVLMNANQIRC